jgi:chromosome segregation ATPase
MQARKGACGTAPEGRDNMRKNDWLKMAAVLAALWLAPLGSYAWQQSSSQQDSSQQTGDPVADAARKAREQKEKKNAAKPKKVYTDDDVRPAEPEKPSVQNATAATPAVAGTEGATGATAPGAVKAEDATKKEDAGEKEDPNGEKAWRKRFSEQHQKIANVEKEIDVLQRELQKSQLQYYTDPQKAMMEQNSRGEINDKTAKIAAKKKELEQLKQQLDDMETELRKAGGDPGWAQ